mgnify:CR=1 FL=1
MFRTRKASVAHTTQQTVLLAELEIRARTTKLSSTSRLAKQCRSREEADKHAERDKRMAIDEVANGQVGTHDATSGRFGRNLRRIRSHHLDGLEDSGATEANGLTGHGLVPVTAVLVLLVYSQGNSRWIDLHLHR